MDRLISLQAAIDTVKKNTFRLTFAEEQNCEGRVAWSANAVYSDVIEGKLLELPSTQPKNIRCYECKHGIHSGCGDVYICNVSPELVMEHTGDFYCGYAKRKTDGEVD